ncbi:MAG: dihydroneopterin aldolase [Prevotella sp.]|nr:dihydroneopterin aldolase [Prevotella sp.]
MKLQSSYIYIKGIRMHANHGVMAQERVVGADFVVDVRAGYDVSAAMRGDDMADAVSYADVFEVIRCEMTRPSALLEHAAGRIGEALFAAFPALTSVDLRITKVNPPMGADCDGAGVELHLTRN